VQLLATSAKQVLHDDAIESISEPSMGSEDFSFYSQQIPAAMFRLGSATGSENCFPLHSANFDITEESLLIGAKIMAHAVILWSAPD
jgi:metal-dependent amidase/aminoacylase/carboxypeptidase family protein